MSTATIFKEEIDNPAIWDTIIRELELPKDTDEIIVKATSRKDRALNEMAQVSSRSFSIEETERFAGSLGDPARMVSSYAGVMIQNDSRNGYGSDIWFRY